MSGTPTFNRLMSREAFIWRRLSCCEPVNPTISSWSRACHGETVVSLLVISLARGRDGERQREETGGGKKKQSTRTELERLGHPGSGTDPFSLVSWNIFVRCFFVVFTFCFRRHGSGRREKKKELRGDVTAIDRSLHNTFRRCYLRLVVPKF